MKRPFFILIIIVCFASTVFPCSMSWTAESGFNENNYMFIGKIIGYTKKYQFKTFNGLGYGIKVELTETITLPQKPKKYFEVIPIGYGVSCQNRGYTKEEIKQMFPKNSSVRVVATLSENKSKNIQLESKYSLPLSRNDLSSEFVSDSKSVFDYKIWKEKRQINQMAFYGFLGFEIHKDLLRIAKMDSLDEKVKVLERLVYCPTINFDSVLIKSLIKFKFQNYQRLYDKRIALVKEGFFN